MSLKTGIFQFGNDRGLSLVHILFMQDTIRSAEMDLWLENILIGTKVSLSSFAKEKKNDVPESRKERPTVWTL